MLGEELEGEGLDVADLWIEQSQRSTALLEQVGRAEQSAYGRRGEELHPGQVHRRCARGHGRAHDHIEPIDVAGFDLAAHQQPVRDDGGLPKVIDDVSAVQLQDLVQNAPVVPHWITAQRPDALVGDQPVDVAFVGDQLDVVPNQ